MWAAHTTASAGMYILCIAPRYNKQNKPENHKSISANKTSRTSVLSLGFRYFEFRNIYKRIPNHIRIPIFSSEFFLDSGSGLLSIWFVLAIVKNNALVNKLLTW